MGTGNDRSLPQIGDAGTRNIIGRNKIRLGFFKYSCCAGCEFQTFYFQRHLPETLNAFEIVFARMVSSGGTPDGPFDLALIEGTITESWQIDELKRIAKEQRAGLCHRRLCRQRRDPGDQDDGART